MKQIKLFPHNEDGYNKLKDCLNDNQMASLNRATGTGKSFILLKYLYDNKDKRILYLSPNYPIIDQLVDFHMKDLGISTDEFYKFDTMIYINLLKMNMEELANNYDIVVLDEYHRCGSPLVGLKINKLLRIIKEKYPNTKVIGASATKIRYLDDERNMNNILFNGVEAADLSLSDAILKGILPIPIYISYNYNLINDLNLIEKRITKYAFYEEDIKRYYTRIKKLKSEVEKLLNSDSDINKYLEDEGKYLVFSSNISSIKKNKKIINQIIKGSTEFEVHSDQKKELNQKILNDFRRANEGNNVLYSVDILNEGVHVKDIDAIFMMRPTTSPIIYFQQLGRILSFSSRKSKVVIFDMVNNIKRHPVIYTFYKEIMSRAKELLPTAKGEEKERYRSILENFKIVDKTSEIVAEIDKLKVELSKDNLYYKRLTTAVNILEDSKNHNYAEVFQAKTDLVKLQNYIDLELFKRIKNLNIDIDLELLDLSLEEFKLLFEERKATQYDLKSKIKIICKKVQEFIDLNYRLPSIFSDDESERDLAKELFNNYIYFGEAHSNFITINVTDDISSLEALTYKQNVNTGYKTLLLESLKAIKLGCKISKRIYLILSKVIKNTKYNKIILDNMIINEDNVLKGENKNKPKKNNNYDSIIFTQYFEENTKRVLKELKETDEDKYIDDLFNKIIDYMNTNKVVLEFNNSNVTLSKEVKDLGKELYCTKILFLEKLREKGYLDIIDECELNLKRKAFERSENVLNLLDFIQNHNGAFPSSKNKTNKDEVSLARFYIHNRHKFSKTFYEKVEIIRKSYPDAKKETLDKYITFIETNGRKPINTYSDEYEVSLNEYLNRWMSEFSEEELERYNNAVKSLDPYKSLERIYEQIQSKKQKN